MNKLKDSSKGEKEANIQKHAGTSRRREKEERKKMIDR